MKTMPTRRIVHASEVVEDAIKKQDLVKPETPTPKRTKGLGELERVERQLHLANLALNKYQRKLEGGVELTPEEERLFLSHQDSIRKLEVSLSQLRARNNMEGKSDLDLAVVLLDGGMNLEDVLNIPTFKNNKEVQDKLREMASGD